MNFRLRSLLKQIPRCQLIFLLFADVFACVFAACFAGLVASFVADVCQMFSIVVGHMFESWFVALVCQCLSRDVLQHSLTAYLLN